MANGRRSPHNVRMTIVTETLAEIAFDGKVRFFGASDAARTSFTAQV